MTEGRAVKGRPIPMVDLAAQYERIRGEVDEAIARVVHSAAFIKGEDCALFEKEFAAYCGAAQACGVANGTDALTVALRAYGVGRRELRRAPGFLLPDARRGADAHPRGPAASRRGAA